MHHRLHPARAALIGVTLFLALPAVATANVLPQLTLGPVRVGHGYRATVLGLGCGTRSASGSVSYSKAGPGWIETHTYGGPNNATCRVAGDQSSATLKFRFRDVTVNVTFRKQGRSKRGALPPGCQGARPLIQPGIATGRVKFSFAKSFFGSVGVQRLKASVTKASYTCGTSRSYKRTIFLSSFSGRGTSALILFATQPPSGSRSVTVTESSGTAKSSERHSITLAGGSSVFNASSDLSSAKLSGFGRITGHLTFRASPSCTGNNRSGQLVGRLVANFDVIGRRTVKENTASPPTLYRNATGAPCS